MPKNEPRARFFGDAEQIKLSPKLSVISLFGFFQLVEIRLQFLGREEGRSINPLELFPMFVSSPI
jgi:hypothetical protein